MEGEGEMEVSDSEDEPQRKKSRNLSSCNEDSEKLQSVKEENDSLRCQLEAYKNEVKPNFTSEKALKIISFPSNY